MHVCIVNHCRCSHAQSPFHIHSPSRSLYPSQFFLACGRSPTLPNFRQIPFPCMLPILPDYKLGRQQGSRKCAQNSSSRPSKMASSPDIRYLSEAEDHFVVIWAGRVRHFEGEFGDGGLSLKKVGSRGSSKIAEVILATLLHSQTI